jgi:hypothetical protein
MLYYCSLVGRRLCIKTSPYSIKPAESNKGAPIPVTPKPKQHKQLNNVFLDNRGFLDVSNKYDHLLHGIDGGPILRKLRHPKPNLSVPVDPLYYLPFIPEKHKVIMRRDKALLHLGPDL